MATYQIPFPRACGFLEKNTFFLHISLTKTQDPYHRTRFDPRAYISKHFCGQCQTPNIEAVGHTGFEKNILFVFPLNGIAT